MNQVIGVINLGDTSSFLGPLTQNRSIASVPFGGRYRLIDFVLSNLVHSGVRNVAVFTLNHARSLMDHLGSGKEWDLNRKDGGLFILPPAVEYPFGVYRGDLQNFYGHIDFFKRSKGEYVIVTKGHMLFPIDFKPLVQSHKESCADITVLYQEMRLTAAEASNCMGFSLENGRVVHMDRCKQSNEWQNVFLETYIVKKSLFIQLIEAAAAKEAFDVNRELLQERLSSLRVQAYRYDGHVTMIHSIESYFRHSMELLRPEWWQSLFFQYGSIYTKIKDEPPARYGPLATARNSLIANGCIIEGTVENSILFRGVKVEKGAHVKNSILLQKCSVALDATVELAILDKEVRVTQGSKIHGEPGMPRVIGKRQIVS
ncbi:glucose-1-phosphate adenylyltransferase subunit GlgD [Fodinisporobacter ferrooxydans]|uniref:Glucose-1-phosphate adenylyltransferase subunit GlgD n=1 Tax=Fodinisporobacter ferrooxydans TaxID=2901836 RepID=A0ABY4CGT0_9BACL|nr:glucose-1-phosphate adenylyltransferase subunit GlgD [Alicyclobacillaceae bacterium MYW30-H2]